MKYEIMNELVKRDISDIVQVNVPSWLTVGWINDWYQLGSDPEAWNEGIQAYGPSVIIVLTIGFTIFKIFRAIQHYRWSRADRMEEISD